MGPESTDITVRPMQDCTIVTLRGEIDLCAVQRFLPRLDGLAEARGALVVDLRSVTFMDCAGLGLLCQAYERVTSNGGRLCLVYTGSCVPRLLRWLGLTEFFPAAPSVSTARHLVTAPGYGVPDEHQVLPRPPPPHRTAQDRGPGS